MPEVVGEPVALGVYVPLRVLLWLLVGDKEGLCVLEGVTVKVGVPVCEAVSEGVCEGEGVPL